MLFNVQWIRKPDFKNISFVDYNSYWEHRGWNLKNKLRRREEIVLDCIPKGSCVIDMGCGNSCLSVKLKEKGCDVAVSDVSDIVLKGYKEHGIEGHIIDLEDAAHIQLTTTYDYIILSEVLEHLRHPEKTIAALKPFTKRFIVSVPNTAAYFYRYGLLVRGRFPAQWTYHPSEHLRYWSYIDFLDWLDAQGLEVEKTVAADGANFGGLVPWLPSLWKNLLAHEIVYVCKVKEE